MMSSLRPDLTTTSIYPEPKPEREPDAIDRFDDLPDSLILLILNNIADVKSLGRCSSVSKRFQSLIPHVQNVVVRVDCVISDDDPTPSSDKSRNPISTLFRIVFNNLVKPLLGPKRSPTSSLAVDDNDLEQGGGVTHHSPTQVLKNFNDIRFLKIELPAGELGVEDNNNNNILLRWRADFGSTLDNCVMLGASSVIYPPPNNNKCSAAVVVDENNYESLSVNNHDNDGSIPESFYTNGGLKLRVVWTISSLIAASARHYLLQPIIADHKTLDEIVLTDADGQGVLCMNREQLGELRVKPLSASSASKRTLVPALNMRLWYAPYLELPDGTVLKGATLVATRPSDQSVVVVPREGSDADADADGLWLSNAFEEPFGTAAKMLLKRRTYCLEMNSF